MKGDFGRILVGIYCILYLILCALYCVLFTLYCISYTVYCVLYTIYCILYIVYCSLCTIYCILYTVQCCVTLGGLPQPRISKPPWHKTLPLGLGGGEVLGRFWEGVGGFWGCWEVWGEFWPVSFRQINHNTEDSQLQEAGNRLCTVYCALWIVLCTVYSISFTVYCML